MITFSQVAFAGLSAVGPFNPVATSNGFPQWYTDANGVSVELPVPPVGDGLTPPTMIFAPVIAGNAYSGQTGFGAEAFYFNARPDPKGFQTRFGKIAALFGLEAGYAGGADPAAGQQVVFARIRINAPVGVAGTYTFFHPYGTESITVTDADIAAKRGIKFTKDIGLAPGWVSDGAGGWLPVASPGGFYSVLDPGNTMSAFLRAVSPAPPAGWIGDGVTLSTVTGSPLGYNKVRLEGPDLNLDGKNHNFVETTLFVVSGKIPATTATPITLSVDRCTCSYINRVENIDLFLTSKQGAIINVTDAALGTLLFSSSVTDVSGKFYASFPGTAKSIAVQATDPTGTFTPFSKTVPVVDYVNITRPTFSLGANVLTVTATSSDFIKHPTTPPTLTLTGVGTTPLTMSLNPTSGVYSLSVPMTTPLPPSVSVNSTVGGSDTATVAIAP